MWRWRFQTFGVVLKTWCRSVFIVIHVSHSCKTAVRTIKMLLRSLLWFSDFLPPVTSYPAWFSHINVKGPVCHSSIFWQNIKKVFFSFLFKKTTASVSSRCSSKSTKKQTWPKTADTEHGGHPSNWLNSWRALTCKPFILCDSWIWADIFVFWNFEFRMWAASVRFSGEWGHRLRRPGEGSVAQPEQGGSADGRLRCLEEVLVFFSPFTTLVSLRAKKAPTSPRRPRLLKCAVAKHQLRRSLLRPTCWSLTGACGHSQVHAGLNVAGC